MFACRDYIGSRDGRVSKRQIPSSKFLDSDSVIVGLSLTVDTGSDSVIRRRGWKKKKKRGKKKRDENFYFFAVICIGMYMYVSICTRNSFKPARVLRYRR